MAAGEVERGVGIDARIEDGNWIAGSSGPGAVARGVGADPIDSGGEGLRLECPVPLDEEDRVVLLELAHLLRGEIGGEAVDDVAKLTIGLDAEVPTGRARPSRGRCILSEDDDVAARPGVTGRLLRPRRRIAWVWSREGRAARGWRQTHQETDGNEPTDHD